MVEVLRWMDDLLQNLFDRTCRAPTREVGTESRAHRPKAMTRGANRPARLATNGITLQLCDHGNLGNLGPFAERLWHLETLREVLTFQHGQVAQQNLLNGDLVNSPGKR